MPAPTAHAATVRYAKPNATGAGTCTSWANACTLQTALASAVSGDEIWVMRETHYPITGTDRAATFQLKSGVAVYGGFVGTETARAQRNPALNVTILSGDIGTVGDSSDNSYHVVTGANGATLDGVTISGGNANSADSVCPSNACGGGMSNYATSPTLTDVIFSGNNAAHAGGGMANISQSLVYPSNPVLSNVTFVSNSSNGFGGGMYNYFNSPNLTNVTFRANQVVYGFGSGLYFDSPDTPLLTNVTFNGNSGGYALDINRTTISNVIIRNSIFWGNGYEIRTTNDGVTIQNSVVAGGCPQIYATCTNLITTDPLLGTLANYGGNVPAIPLLPGSSAQSATTSNCPATDARGIARGTTCDLGAFESQGFVLTKTGGDHQTTGTSAPFAQPLALTVTSTHGEPVDGGVVTFAGPLTGASTNPITNTAIIASGAVSKTLSANSVAGTYTVNAGTGVPTSAAFTLTNTVIYNVNLSNLTLSTGTLNPGFASATTSYTTTVRAPKISVTPTAADPTATITVNGTSVVSGSASGEIALNIGSTTTITIVVTASDGFASKTYTLTVTQDCTGYTVTSNADDGAGSLRYGLASVCANATISFNDDYTITLASQLVINKSLTITGAGHQVTLSGNHAVRIFDITGGNSTFDSLNLINGQVSDQGGAMQLEHSTGVNIVNSTFSGNYGTFGGGAIYSLANSLIINNSTFANNSSRDHGGALVAMQGYGCGTTTLTHNTFYGNSAGTGGAIHNYYCTTTLKNNIFVKTSGANACDNTSGTIADGGGNLMWGDTSCPGLNANPILGALSNYGGDVPTLPLLPGSAAIDAASANCPTTDARGIARGTTCDAGAFESRGFILTKSGGDHQTTGASAPFAQPLALTVTSGYGEPVDGGVVTFVGPLTGASTTPITNTAIIASGAVSKTLSANSITGTYTVNANIGVPAGATFTLTNTVAYNVNLSQLTLSTGTLNPGFAPATTSYTATARALKLSVTPTAADPTATITVNGTPVASGSASGEIALNTGAPTTLTIVVTASDGLTNKTYTLMVTYDCTGYLVTSNADSGTGSLRHGLASVCTNATISFDNDYTITLTSQLELNKTITITGLGHHITLNGNHAVRVLHVPGGVHPTLDRLHIINGNFSSNDCAGSAFKCGGGMLLEYNAAATIANSTFSGNGSSGSSGVWDGGAIYSYWSALTITNSTFSGNNAYIYGGAIRIFYGSATLTNNTFSGNSNTGYGGAILNNSGTVTLRNNIFTNNTAPTGPNCSSAGVAFTDNGGNVENGTSCGFSTANGSFPGTNPVLGALADNGGSAPTFALLPNSPAIDAGNAASCPPIDQRGETRDDLHCDSGAYELKYPDSPTVARSTSSATMTTFGPTLVGLQRDAAFTNPGVITVTKEAWNRQGPESIGVVWNLTPTVTSGFSLTLQLCYTDAEFGSLTENNLRFWSSDGITWTMNTIAPTFAMINGYRCATLSSIDHLSRWTLASDTPTAMTLQDFTAQTNAPTMLPLLLFVVVIGGLVLLRRKRLIQH